VSIRQYYSFPTGATRQVLFRGPVSFYVNDGGGWDLVGTYMVNYQYNTVGFGPDWVDVEVERDFYWPNAIGLHGGLEFGLSDNGGVDSTLEEIYSVEYTYNTPAADRTACPADETCVVNVRPKN
jgi:hypothetical protein